MDRWNTSNNRFAKRSIWRVRLTSIFKEMSKPKWNALKKIKYTYLCQLATCLTVPPPHFFPSNIIITRLVLPVKKETKHLGSLGAEPYQRAQTRWSHSEKTTHMHAHNAARWMGPPPQHNGAKLNHWCQIEKKKGGGGWGWWGQNASPSHHSLTQARID